MELSKISSVFKSLELVLGDDDKQKLGQISNAYFRTVDENFQLREEVHTLKKQLADKDRQIRELNEQRSERRKLTFDSKRLGYMIELDNGEVIGPVCPKCHKETASIVLLEETNGGAVCPNCKSRYPGVKASVEGYKQTIW